jgi:hypothetical protein
VLSACQTALGSGRIADVPPGDDWVGLTRAFLHAGAAQVAATLWAIEDRATAVLMERFYRQLGSGAGAVHALAIAQREAPLPPGHCASVSLGGVRGAWCAPGARARRRLIRGGWRILGFMPPEPPTFRTTATRVLLVQLIALVALWFLQRYYTP